uniref:Uncharacterized protein n=1 Tax=Lactuca sativa TaxID=4236 RepID=A0A9R1VZ79_LACSA|nr:hypothetical protein LSAT_V11C400210190 [Lactuca sativa]
MRNVKLLLDPKVKLLSKLKLLSIQHSYFHPGFWLVVQLMIWMRQKHLLNRFLKLVNVILVVLMMVVEVEFPEDVIVQFIDDHIH